MQLKVHYWTRLLLKLKGTPAFCLMDWEKLTSVTADGDRNKRGSTIAIYIYIYMTLHGSSCIRALTIWWYFTALLIKRYSYRHCNSNSRLFNATVLSHHQFQNFVEGNRSAHDNALYLSAVRWLSRGVVLRTFSFVDQSRYFHHGTEQNWPWLLHFLWTDTLMNAIWNFKEKLTTVWYLFW